MAVTCTTLNGSLNLNDGTSYYLLGFSWDNGRNQTIMQFRGNPRALIASDDYTMTTLHISLRVKGTSQTDLVNKVKAVRDEFAFPGVDNKITYAWGGGSGNEIWITRPTNIQPPNYTNASDTPLMAIAASQFTVPRWDFDVLADPIRQNELYQPVI